MKISPPSVDPPPGLDLHVVDPDEPVATFAAQVGGATIAPGGDAKVIIVVPFDQIPRMMPIMQHVGGSMFEVQVCRVPTEELPGGGW